MNMKIAVVGAKGMVGTVMLKVLKERSIQVSELIPVASSSSKGKSIRFGTKDYPVVTIMDALNMKPDVALFSAGGRVSLEWAEKFAEIGCRVIDNSSAWRMDPNKKLIVPEINAYELGQSDFIIANPNCSTIQLLMALKPMEDLYGLKRVIVSTYQSITGTGKKALDQMENEREGKKDEMVYPYPIDKNCLPHCDDFMDNDYTKEEMKLLNESRKILGLPKLRLTATAVRVPVVGGHSEAVNVEFERSPDLQELRSALASSKGIILQDNPDTNQYPMPIYAEGKDEVFVGRLRRDESAENAINMWVVSDNLRKGAATNAVQILEYLIDNSMIQTQTK